MIESPAVLIRDRGPVRILTLNRPERRNALNLEDRRELVAAVNEAQSDQSCRVIVLAGSGGVFCAGGDIASMSQDPDIARIRLGVVNDIARALIGSAKPTIAAVETGAFGLGLSLAVACDFVIAAADARFVASFAKLGLVADTGLSWSLSQRIGPGRAKEMILLGHEIEAQRAQQIGLISEVVAPGDVMAAAFERAEQLAALSSNALAATKKIFAQANQDVESILSSEMDEQLQLLGSDDFAEGRAAFLERRAPNFLR